MPKTTWIIQDWTGRELTAFGTFTSFQAGWDAIYEKVEDIDNAYDDYYVVETKEALI